MIGNQVVTSEKLVHIFGGGQFAVESVRVVREHGCRVVVRTGDRFLPDFSQFSSDASVGVFSSNSFSKVMSKGPLPKPPDLGLSFSAPWIIPESTISLFDQNIFNLHNQPLPRFRGAGGSSWNILMDERSGGSSIHRLVAKVDAGEICQASSYRFPDECVTPEDFDAYSTLQGKNLLVSWLTELLRTGGIGTLIENSDSESEYWPRLNTQVHGWINLNWKAEDIVLFCRAFSDPHEGAKTLVNGVIIYIKDLEFDPEKKFHPFQQGLIFNKEDGVLFAAHRDGTLVIKRYEYDSDDFRVSLGDRLYTPVKILERALQNRIQYKPDGTMYIVNSAVSDHD